MIGLAFKLSTKKNMNNKKENKLLGPERGPTMYTKEISDMFNKAKTYMDLRRDKDEQIMRFSRDITWESKKIIYTLHQFFQHGDALKNAEGRINELLKNERFFLGLARALEGQDMSLHYRRYTHCLQEYIEAFVFLSFLKNKRIPTYEEIRDKFIFQIQKPDLDVEETEDKISTTMTDIDIKNISGSSAPQQIVQRDKTKRLIVPVSITDYILGVADFTGELMKAAVPTLTRPQWHSFLCQSFAMVREIYAQLMGVHTNTRYFKQKMSQMRSNVMKIEATVYKLKIKILLYGRLPDSKELQMIELSVASQSVSKEGEEHNSKSNDLNQDSGVE